LGSSAYGISAGSYCFNSYWHAFAACGGRVSPRRARYLFFASPKKSTQKKGETLLSATPALRYGATCGARRRRIQKGWESNIHTGHRCARPRAWGRAQRRPVSGFQPPSGCACGGVLAGWRVCRRTHPLRDLTRRICLNAAAQQRSELCGAPRKHPDAGCPAGAAGCGARFFASFLVAHKKGGRPPGRVPASALQKSTSKTIKTIATCA